MHNFEQIELLKEAVSKEGVLLSPKDQAKIAANAKIRDICWWSSLLTSCILLLSLITVFTVKINLKFEFFSLEEISFFVLKHETACLVFVSTIGLLTLMLRRQAAQYEDKNIAIMKLYLLGRK